MRKVVYQVTALLALVTFIGYWSISSQEPQFVINEQWIKHSKYPLRMQSTSFKQQLLVLTPKGANQHSTVFFVLGNETDATKEKLISIYKNYGSPEGTIFMTAEHRGYGESVTDESQDIPDYVNADNALTDYHKVISELRRVYQGKWIIAGYSYGGALAIKYAYQYPDSYEVVLSSSAPIYWPQYFNEYGLKVEENLGSEFVGRLSAHFQNLSKQGTLTAQRHIELITAVIVGLSQMDSMQYLKPVISGLSYLSTDSFMASLEMLLPDKAYTWVNGQINTKAPLLAEQRNWYTWKYQQCNELGTFFTGLPFSNTEATYIERCQESFGFRPRAVKADNWQLDKLLPQITKPIVVVSGGNDPWLVLGVKPNHTFKNINYIYDEKWFHSPDRSDPDAGKQVFSALIKLLQNN